MATLVEFAKHNLSILKDNTEQFMPGIFCMEGEIKLHNNYASTSLSLNKQIKIDDLTDMLEKYLSVNILYAIEDEKKENTEVIAYSLPMNDKMYSIKLFSYQYGLVSSVDVSFFSSFDVMFFSLKHKLQNKPSDWTILEEIEPAKFFSHFS